MKIIVLIKQVPSNNKTGVDPDTGVILRAGVESKMNPYDLYALETALLLREMHGRSVTVLSMGPPQAEEVIKEAYSLGADAGVLLTDRKFAGSDVLATSYALSQAIDSIGNYDLVLCGKQTTDGDTAQVGSETAEFLGIPSASGIVSFESFTGTSITVVMDMPSTLETVSIQLPCLLSVEKEIATPRLPSYLRKLETTDRAIKILTFADLKDKEEQKYGLNGSPTQVHRIFPPPVNNTKELWEGSAQELAVRMFDEFIRQKLI